MADCDESLIKPELFAIEIPEPVNEVEADICETSNSCSQFIHGSIAESSEKDGFIEVDVHPDIIVQNQDFYSNDGSDSAQENEIPSRKCLMSELNRKDIWIKESLARNKEHFENIRLQFSQSEQELSSVLKEHQREIKKLKKDLELERILTKKYEKILSKILYENKKTSGVETEDFNGKNGFSLINRFASKSSNLISYIPCQFMIDNGVFIMHENGTDHLCLRLPFSNLHANHKEVNDCGSCYIDPSSISISDPSMIDASEKVISTRRCVVLQVFDLLLRPDTFVNPKWSGLTPWSSIQKSVISLMLDVLKKYSIINEDVGKDVERFDINSTLSTTSGDHIYSTGSESAEFHETNANCLGSVDTSVQCESSFHLVKISNMSTTPDSSLFSVLNERNSEHYVFLGALNKLNDDYTEHLWNRFRSKTNTETPSIPMNIKDCSVRLKRTSPNHLYQTSKEERRREDVQTCPKKRTLEDLTDMKSRKDKKYQIQLNVNLKSCVKECHVELMDLINTWKRASRSTVSSKIFKSFFSRSVVNLHEIEAKVDTFSYVSKESFLAELTNHIKFVMIVQYHSFRRKYPYYAHCIENVIKNVRSRLMRA